jgi:hypothetical protein
MTNLDMLEKPLWEHQPSEISRGIIKVLFTRNQSTQVILYYCLETAVP